MLESKEQVITPKHEDSNGSSKEFVARQIPNVDKSKDASNEPKNVNQRSTIVQYLGKLFIITTLISFIFIGLLLNLIQLILTLTIGLSNSKSWRRWHKWLTGQIVYAVFAQPVFLIYAWPRWDLNIVLEDINLLDDMQKKNIFGIIIANHTFELDWMTCFIMADQLGNMGNYKCFSKDELKWLPIVGWTFWMADLIYVKRDWKRDRLRIADKLNQLLDYDQILLGIFAEGTRWTEEKYEDAVKFAKSRSIVPYKYHLFPRPRGFNYTLRHYLRADATTTLMKRQNESSTGPIRVFNLEIVHPDKPNFTTFLEGGLIRAHVYCEEVHLNEELRMEALNSRDEDDCPKLTQLLQDIFWRKDQFIDEFMSNGQKFPIKSPGGGKYPIKKPIKAFIYWLTGMSITYGTFFYLACQRAHSGSLACWSVTFVLFLASGVLLLKRIERESLPTKLRKKETDKNADLRSKSSNGVLLDGNDANGHSPTARRHLLSAELSPPVECMQLSRVNTAGLGVPMGNTAKTCYRSKSPHVAC